MQEKLSAGNEESSPNRLLSIVFPDPVRELIEDPDLAETIRGRQVAAVKITTPLMLLANGVVLAGTAWVLYGSVDAFNLTTWSLILATFLVIGAANIKFQWRVNPKIHPRKHTRRTELNSLVLASTWAVMPVLFFSDASVAQKVFITAIMAGMMGGGTMVLGVIPKAASLFVWTFTAGSLFTLFTLFDTTMMAVCVLLMTYAIALSRAANEQGRRFVTRFLDGHELEEQRATIGMLLKDFENSSSDWMWETCEAGNIRAPSARFCESVGTDEAELEGKSFRDLVSLPQAKGSSELNGSPLATRLSVALVFTDHVVQVDTNLGPRWWSLTGKPIVDSKGVLQGFRGTASDVQDAKNAQDKLNSMALYDQLTGLPNRNRFYEFLENTVQELALEKSDGAALIYIDLDRFKNVNDNLGHSLGDALLKEATNRLQVCIRESDKLARFGGDEFAILCRSENIVEDAEAVAQAVLDHLTRPFLIQGHTIALSGSIGLAFADSADGDSELWFRNADMALHRAKQKGGAQFKVFKPLMGERLQQLRQLEIDLRQAVVEKQFEMIYQPIVNAATGEINAFEAFIRWNHSERGRIMPQEFLPIAVETGLIKEIDTWVLERACKDAASWAKPYRVCVNISSTQILSQRLLLNVMKTLETSGLDPNRLVIEVPEQVLDENSERIIKLLSDLRNLGLAIALDDFGTGRSSLSYLVRFPFDHVKIDNSLVHAAEDNAEDQLLVRSIVNLTRDLGIDVIAEGVENETQMEEMRSLGCRFVQGFWISEPKLVSQFPQLKLTEKVSGQNAA